MIDKIKVALDGFKKALAIGSVLVGAGEALICLLDKSKDD